MPGTGSHKQTLPGVGEQLHPGIGVPVGRTAEGLTHRWSSCTLHIPWDGFSIH